MTSTWDEAAAEPAGLVPLLESGLQLSDTHDDVRGLTVLDPNGHVMGEVEDLVIDMTHRRVRLLMVTGGGVLGFGNSRSFIPVDLVTCVDEDVHVARDHLDLPAITTARGRGDGPRNCAGDDPELVVAPSYADIYAYYGFTPFWGVDYVTPYFHRR